MTSDRTDSPDEPGPEESGLDDPDRLASLAAAGLLEPGPDELFDRLTRAVRRRLGVPVALVTVVDAERQLFRSSLGLPEPWASRRETPLSHSFCRHVVGSGAPLVVADAREEERLRGSPAIEELGVVAYAGVPLRGPEGTVLGSVAAADGRPREWSEADVGFLGGLAAVAEDEVARRARDPGGDASPSASPVRERLLLEQVPAVVWTTDRELTFTSSTGAGLEGLGLEPGETVGTTVPEYLGTDDESDPAIRMHHRALEGEAGEYEIEAFDRHFQCRVEPLMAETGETVGIVGCALDVTDRVRAQRELERTEERYRTLLALAPIAMFLDRDGEILYANEAGAELLGVGDPAELVGREVLDFVPPESEEAVRRRIRQVEGRGEPSDVRELALQRLDGTRRIGEIRSIPVTLADATVSLSIIRDVTEERRARRALLESERRFRSLFEDSRDAIYLTSANGEIEAGNRAFHELFGYDPEEMATLRAGDLYADPDERERFRAAIEQTGSVKDFEVRAVRADGTTFPCLLTATVRVDGEGAVLGYQGIARDVTEQRRFERRLEHQALHDELTGLPNRSLFWDRLEHAIARARREEGDHRLAVLFVDLDRFKRVNDSLGHGAGDQVLAETARRLRSQFREEDTVARFGGDEFTVLLESVQEGEDVAEAAARFLEVLEEPMQVEGEAVHLTASIGVAVGEPAALSSERADPDELVRRADSAMFRAKEGARSSVRFYDPTTDEGRRGRLQRERALRVGLEQGEFSVHFQPIVDLASGRVVGVEPLARWEHPERGTVLPDDFIALAEESGLIVPLGEALLEESLAAAAAWRERDDVERLIVQPNLSPRQFDDPQLIVSVERRLASSGLRPEDVRFEVTERLAMRGSERLAELRSLGVGITVDDFGTGYSSLNYLKRLEVDALKIDLSFVRGLGDDPRDEAIVRAIITLGEAMDLEVVAEGIERRPQLEALRAFGCRFGQGFHFARPLPRDRFEELLDRQPLG